MKTLLCCVAVFTALSGAAMPAQDIVGTWQGTVPASGHRLVLKISKSDGNALKVDAYDLDSGAQRVPLNDATFDNSTLKFPLTGHNGNYVGKMSADGNTIVGPGSRKPTAGLRLWLSCAPLQRWRGLFHGPLDRQPWRQMRTHRLRLPQSSPAPLVRTVKTFQTSL